MDKGSRRALVTGGAGYIGSHIVRALAAAGHRVVVYDDLSSGHADLVRCGSLVVGDVRDADALSAVFRSTRPELVVHCAAKTEIAHSWAVPGLFEDVNVTGTKTLVEVARSHGRPPILFSSTGAVYAPADDMLLTEDARLGPVNPYGRTKLAAEEVLRSAGEADDLHCGIFRFFNAAGADWETGLGEDHDPETHLIPRTLRSILDLPDPLIVFGGDHPTPDGSPIRDYVGVRDIAAAHVAAAAHLLRHRRGFTVNLGTGHGCSVREVIRAAEAATGRHISFDVGPRRRGDAVRLVADCRLAERLLQWRAVGSDLPRLVDQAWQWHRRRHAPEPPARPGRPSAHPRP